MRCGLVWDALLYICPGGPSVQLPSRPRSHRRPATPKQWRGGGAARTSPASLSASPARQFRPACRKLVGFPPPRLAAQLAPSLFSSAWLTLLSCLVHTWREYRPRHSQFLEQLSPPLLCDRPAWSGILLLILRLGFFCSQFNFPGTLHE